MRRGENQGRTLPHKNVVHGLTRLGQWTGVPLTKEFAPAEPGLRTAVLVQAARGGRILAAASD